MTTNLNSPTHSTPLRNRGAGATRREQKHEMLLTFMANTKTQKRTRRPAPVKPKLLRTLLSFFL